MTATEEGVRQGKTEGSSTCREPVYSVDLAWRRMDHPTNLTVINGVLMFDQPLDPERFRATLEERLVVISRFHQCLVREGGKAHWEQAGELDWDYHLRWESLGGDGDEQALRQRVGELMSQPLASEHPLWRFHVLDGFQGGSALLTRIHHCIGDGLAMMMVLLSLTDLHSDRGSEAPHEDDRDNPLTALFHRAHEAADRAVERVEAVLPEALKLLTKPAEVLRETSAWLKGLGSVTALGRLTFKGRDARTLLKGPLGQEKRVAWSRALPLEQIARLRKRLGGTLNDVLITAISGGLRRYLQERGEDPGAKAFRALVPVSIRPLEEISRLGNRFGLVLLTLPVDVADPVERLETLRQRFRSLHRSMEPMVAYRILGAMGLAPQRVQRWVMRFFTAKATAVMTSVPGPGQVLYLAGRPIRGLMFWVPHPGALGLGISILSYAGEVRLGLAVDAGLVPDPQCIIDAFHEEMESMEEHARRQSSTESQSREVRHGKSR